jgi:hypothetical protein
MALADDELLCVLMGMARRIAYEDYQRLPATGRHAHMLSQHSSQWYKLLPLERVCFLWYHYKCYYCSGADYAAPEEALKELEGKSGLVSANRDTRSRMVLVKR